MAGDTWAPVVTLHRFGFVVPTVVSQQLGREQSWEGHGALPHNREQCRKVEKNGFQWSDLFSFGLSLWLNHYPVPIAQSLPGTCPL